MTSSSERGSSPEFRDPSESEGPSAPPAEPDPLKDNVQRSEVPRSVFNAFKGSMSRSHETFTGFTFSKPASSSTAHRISHGSAPYSFAAGSDAKMLDSRSNRPIFAAPARSFGQIDTRMSGSDARGFLQDANPRNKASELGQNAIVAVHDSLSDASSTPHDLAQSAENGTLQGNQTAFLDSFRLNRPGGNSPYRAAIVNLTGPITEADQAQRRPGSNSETSRQVLQSPHAADPGKSTASPVRRHMTAIFPIRPSKPDQPANVPLKSTIAPSIPKKRTSTPAPLKVWRESAQNEKSARSPASSGKRRKTSIEDGASVASKSAQLSIDDVRGILSTPYLKALDIAAQEKASKIGLLVQYASC